MDWVVLRRAAAHRTLTATAAALTAYFATSANTCTGVECGAGDSHALAVAALVLALVIAVPSWLIGIHRVTKGLPGEIQTRSGVMPPWVRASQSAVLFSTVSAIIGMLFVVIAAHNEWTCARLAGYFVTNGVAHILGAGAVFTSALLSRASAAQATVTRFAVAFMAVYAIACGVFAKHSGALWASVTLNPGSMSPNTGTPLCVRLESSSWRSAAALRTITISAQSARH